MHAYPDTSICIGVIVFNLNFFILPIFKISVYFEMFPYPFIPPIWSAYILVGLNLIHILSAICI